MKSPKFIIGVIAFVIVFVIGIMLADKYGNSGTASANAVDYSEKLYGETPKSVVCPAVGMASDENWISCTVLMPDGRKDHLLCTGLFDAIVNSCRPQKAVFK